MGIPVSIFTALRDAVTESFETFAFAEVTGWDECNPQPEGMEGYIGSRIQVKRPVSGVLSLFLDREQCAGLVEAVSGIDPSGMPEKMEILTDFLNELINTIAGRFTASIAGDTKTTGLGLPSVVGEWELVWGGRDREQNIVFTVDGKRAFLRVEGI